MMISYSLNCLKLHIKNTKIKQFLILLQAFYFSTFFCLNAFGAETMWVSSKNAKLKKSQSASSKTIATLKKGTELSVKSKKKRWFRVRASNGKVGWIYKGKVSDIKPDVSFDDQESESNTLGDLFGSISGGGISADSADTSRSIRGLSSETKEYARETNTPQKYEKSLDKILTQKITEQEIENFLKLGKIGEYAE